MSSVNIFQGRISLLGTLTLVSFELVLAYHHIMGSFNLTTGKNAGRYWSEGVSANPNALCRTFSPVITEFTSLMKSHLAQSVISLNRAGSFSIWTRNDFAYKKNAHRSHSGDCYPG